MVIEVLQTRNSPGAIDRAPRRALESGLGDGLQRLGEGINRGAEVLAAAERTNEMNDLRVKMINGFGEIGRDLESDIDAAGMPQRYDERMLDLENDLFAEISNESVRSALGVTFASQRAALQSSVQRRAFDMGQGQAIANLESGLTSLVDMAARADDPRVAEAFMDEADDLITSNVDAGWIMPQIGQRYRQKLTDDVANAAAGRLVESDPVAAEIALGEDGALGLSEADRNIWLGRARRRNEQEASGANSVTRQRVNFAVNQLLDGRKISNIDEVAALAAGTEFEPALTAAIAANQVLGDFYATKPGDRAAEIQRRKTAGVADGVEADTLTAMEQIHGRALTAIETDPIAYAASSGMVNAGGLDLGDAASIEKRIALVDTLRKDYRSPLRYFSDAEVDEFKLTINGDSVEDQLALAVAITDGFGNRAHAALEELGQKDPVFAHAGHLVAMTGGRDAATFILSGVKARQAGDEVALVAVERDDIAASTIGGALRDAPQGLRETMLEAAKAYYAAKAPGLVGPDDDRAAKKLWTEALQAAAGRTVDASGVERGGFAEINDTQVLLPPDLSADNVDAILELADMNAWRKASFYGGAPMEGDDEWALDADNVILRAIPGGVYLVGIRRRGRIEVLQDAKSPRGVFVIDLHRLAAALPTDATPKKSTARDVGGLLGGLD